MDRENIESIFPLLPMQEAFMLARQHAERDPGVLQATYHLEGQLELAAFEQSLQAVFQRHELLRASIQTRTDKSPLMVTWKNVNPQIALTDLSGLAKEQQDVQCATVGEQELTSGLVLNKAPAHRFHLLKLGDEAHQLLWTFHHVFLDGWSNSIVIRDWLNEYQGMQLGNTLGFVGTPLRYSDFLAWRKTLSTADQAMFWKEHFADYAGHQKIFGSLATYGGGASALRHLQGSPTEAEAKRLNELLQAHQLTPNSIAIAAWALALADLCGDDDLAFATTVSGRAIPVDGIENTVGLFSNISPIRVSIDKGATVSAWIESIRNRQFELQQYERMPLDDISTQCKLARDRVMLETLLVVENFPVFENDGELRLKGFESGLSTGFPLTICIFPADGWRVRCVSVDAQVDDVTAKAIKDRVVEVLARLPDSFDGKIESFRASLPSLRNNSATVSQANTENHSDGRPRNATELKLVMLWESVLGVSEVRVDDSFFDIGGKSLTAIRLLRQVNEEFNQSFSPAILLESPTVESLAKLLQCEAGEAKSKTLIAFNQPDTGQPIVCVHAGDIEAMYFRFLAKYFPDRPVVALQSHGLDGQAPLESVPEIASSHLGELRERFGNRRFHLVGYCAGCQVALELAKQIEQSGESVGSLVVIDSGIKYYRLELCWKYYMQQFRSVFLAAPRYARELMRRFDRRLKRSVWNVWMRISGPGNLDRYNRRRVLDATMKAYFSYEASVGDAPILLVRSSEYVAMPSKDFHLKWAEQTGAEKFSTQTVTGGHETILLEPTVELVAKVIANEIENRECCDESVV